MKRFLFFSALSLMVAAISAGGYYYWEKTSLERDPDYIALKTISDANELYSKEKYKESLEKLNELEQNYKDSAAIYAQYAEIYFAMKDWENMDYYTDKALEKFVKSTKYNPLTNQKLQNEVLSEMHYFKSIKPYEEYTKTYNKENLKTSLKHLSKSMEYLDTNTGATILAGKAHAILGNELEALDKYYKIILIDQKSAKDILTILYPGGYATFEGKNISYYSKSCLNGNMEDCLSDAYIHDVGIGGVKNTKYAANIYETLCDVNYGERFPHACTSLAIKHYKGELGTTNKYEKSLKYADKACKLGSIAGCGLAAELSFSTTYNLKNDKKAHWYAKKSCPMSAISCKIQGLTTKNKKESLELLKTACEKKNAISCALVGDELFEKKTHHQAVKYYQESCNLGYDYACKEYAGMLLKGTGIEQSITESTKIYKDLCNKNIDYCNRPGWEFFGLGLDQTALEFFNKGCNDMEPFNCFNLATIMIDSGNIKSALQAYTKGCMSNSDSYAKQVNCMANEIFNPEINETNAKEMEIIKVHENGCEKNKDGEACAILALHHYKFIDNDNRTELLIKKAEDTFLETCNKENPEYCRARDIFLGLIKNKKNVIKKPSKEGMNKDL